VCIFKAALAVRKCGHGNTLSERSIVIVSSVSTVFARLAPKSPFPSTLRAVWIKTLAKSR
jgi:hypothetical protein